MVQWYIYSIYQHSVKFVNFNINYKGMIFFEAGIFLKVLKEYRQNQLKKKFWINPKVTMKPHIMIFLFN